MLPADPAAWARGTVDEYESLWWNVRGPCGGSGMYGVSVPIILCPLSKGSLFLEGELSRSGSTACIPLSLLCVLAMLSAIPSIPPPAAAAPKLSIPAVTVDAAVRIDAE